eukprot:scaffold292522_cov19-Tisochrysis_lutea.AAC.2
MDKSFQASLLHMDMLPPMAHLQMLTMYTVTLRSPHLNLKLSQFFKAQCIALERWSITRQTL